MCPLKVDTLAGGISRDQDKDVLILDKRLLNLAALLAGHPAMDHHNRLSVTEQSPELSDKVVQGVAVLAEDDQLPAVTTGIEHLFCALDQIREFLPLAVLPRTA